VCELSEQLRDPSALVRGLSQLAYVSNQRGEVLRAREIMRRWQELAEQLKDSEMTTLLDHSMAMNAMRSGDLLEASARFSDLMKRLVSAESGVTQFSPVNLWAQTPAIFALIQQALGRSEEALKLSEEALRRSRELKQSFSLAVVIMMAGTLRYFRREAQAAGDLAQAEIALAEEHGFRERLASARALRGWAMSELGDTQQGIAELEPVAASARSAFQMRALEMVARIYARVGWSDRALALVDQALAQAESSGAHLREPELYGLKGEAILMRDSSAAGEAEDCFRKAIEIAKGQSAKWWELRATNSLACLLRDTNRRDEGRAMLAEIYGWFTEGFDTADLKDAKALLDELGG
jgi:tetratricopeptide (TPR) repeat protein